MGCDQENLSKLLFELHASWCAFETLGIPLRLAFNSLQFVIKNEGLLSLFNGNLINCIRIFPQSAIQVATYETTKKYFNGYNINTSFNYFLSGSIAGLVSSFAVHPLETIRSKLSAQSNKNSYNSISDCVSKIYLLYLYNFFI